MPHPFLNLNAVARVFLGPVCEGCHRPLTRPLESPVCEACWADVRPIRPPFCVCCGDAYGEDRGSGPCARCRHTPRNFESARSAGQYDGRLRDLIHAFKYRRRRVLAASLAAMIAQAGSDLLADADALVPVPLHPWRSFRRGFNQADDLARYVGLPVWRVLRRSHGGVPQAALPAHRRRANVEGAFQPQRRPHAILTRHDLQHRTVVLIDDVMTTGATLDACSQALLRCGVRTVRALTVARAVSLPPSTLPRSRHPSPVPHR